MDNKLQAGKQHETIEVDFDDPITLTFNEINTQQENKRSIR